MGALLKWGGLVGALALVAGSVLEVAGLSEAAAALKTLGGLFGSTVPAGDIAAAVLSGSSVIKKLWAEFKRLTGRA
jgi:hypothetical protein